MLNVTAIRERYTMALPENWTIPGECGPTERIIKSQADVGTLLNEIDRLQSGGCASDQRTTQFCAEAVAKDVEIQRLASELATAHADIQRLWVEINWQVHRTVLRATVGAFRLDVSRDGWELKIRGMSMDYYWIASGPETGIDGQRAAEAAYRRAIGHSHS